MLDTPRLTIQAFTCDGTKMRILKTITLDPGQDIQDVVFPGGHAKVCVSTRVCRLDRTKS